MGASALANAGKYSYMFGEENTLQAAAGMTVGVGIIIFLVGFTGCCGACKQSTCLLKIVCIGSVLPGNKKYMCIRLTFLITRIQLINTKKKNVSVTNHSMELE